MQAPKNRQEFLTMQQQAAAAARDMQRRATLPMPPKPQFRQPEPLHHRSPSQQARQAASYGRMQPQMRRQEWQAPPKPTARPQPQPREAHHHRGQPPPPAPAAC